MLEHASGKDRYALALCGDVSHEVRPAEDEQGLDLEAGDAFEQLLLCVGLLEHFRIDPVNGDASRMALGLDRKDASRADQYVVDVASPERDAVESPPPLVLQLRQDLAHRTLALRAPEPAVGLGRVEAVRAEHHPQRDKLDEGEWQPPKAEHGPGRRHHQQPGAADQHRPKRQFESASAGMLTWLAQR